MSRARRARLQRAWRRYGRRYDALLYHGALTARLAHPHRLTPGFFRVCEGWDPPAAVYVARGYGFRGWARARGGGMVKW